MVVIWEKMSYNPTMDKLNRDRKKVSVTLAPDAYYILDKFKTVNRSQFVDELAAFWLHSQKFTVNTGKGVSVTVSLKQFASLLMWETDYGDVISPEFRSEKVAIEWLEKTYKTELN